MWNSGFLCTFLWGSGNPVDPGCSHSKVKQWIIGDQPRGREMA